MNLLIQQQNIYDKFDALRGDSEHDLAFWRVLTWGMVTILIVVSCWLLYQWLVRQRAAQADRRSGLGKTKKRNVEDGGGRAKTGESLGHRDFVREASASGFPMLDSVPVGTTVALYWDVGELRCGARGISKGGDASRLVVALDCDRLIDEGAATLLCPEAAGHVLFYRVRVGPGPEPDLRELVIQGPKPVSRIHHKYRANANLRAAAARGEEAILVRIQDVAFDGFGLLSEAELHQGESLVFRIDLPDYLEPVEVKGRVAWAEVDPVGVWRGGVELDHGDPNQRLALADFLLSTIKSESAQIVIEQRRREHTPVRPQPVEPIA
ncbi:MAG: PilZ domain-containing protein [Planctomycetes bacterium]|nr:PilZ domain-containing protein [Planctomycetota bacterium]